MTLTWVFLACINGFCVWSQHYPTYEACLKEQTRIQQETGAVMTPLFPRSKRIEVGCSQALSR